MPTISLRLTEEEHAALKNWAHDSRRSLQKEAVFRIFDGQLSEGAAVSQRGRSGDVATAGAPRHGDVAAQEFESPTVVPSESRHVEKCQYDTPAGTKCKVCGKVHAL